MDDRLQAKLRKLQALAERGVGGEKAYARRMLEKMLERHGLTLDSLEEERRSTYWFKVKSRVERSLALQVAGKVCQVNKINYLINKSRRNQIGFKLTPAEAIEFEIYFDTMRKALGEHLQVAFEAFVQANRLFGPSADTDESPNLTDDDLRMLEMAAAIKPTAVAKRLPSSTTGGA